METTRNPNQPTPSRSPAKRIDARSPDRISRAEFLVGVGRLDEAQALIERILAADRTHIGALELYAKLLWQRCEFGRLLSILFELVALNPYEPGYFSLKGAVLQSMGRYGEAYTALIRCCALTQDKPDSAVTAMVADLECWQSSLISELLEEDVLFRLEYERDPVEACRTRGFEIEHRRAVAWMPNAADPAPLYVRPS